MLFTLRPENESRASLVRTLILAACLGCLSLSLISCKDLPAADGSTGTPAATSTASTLIADPAKNAKFVANVNIATTVLKLGGSQALKSFTVGEEQLRYAQLLSGSGHIFEALVGNEDLTSVTDVDTYIYNAYAAYFPSTAADYTQLATIAAGAVKMGISFISAYIPEDTKNSQPAIYAAYFAYVAKQLAKTAYDVADPILKANAATTL